MFPKLCPPAPSAFPFGYSLYKVLFLRYYELVKRRVEIRAVSVLERGVDEERS
ncbi:hypothetical protein HMPREF1986_01333 [Oribacterium sp. oral taxon 078 str. F0263]|nr:hypothetical protein GCWU000341_01099 [Oribacterium sp. oral taxon 078 str. F0262]ERL21566.1 hypothetical protein HMPREF1986_01333 [Oribacterium sp. oral taxon 078 str. F0263]